MKQQTQLSKYERVQTLYRLKSGEANSIAHVSRILGHKRTTIQRWLYEYRQGGITYLLSARAHGGRQASISPWTQAKLRDRLQQPRDFISDGPIGDWLARECNIHVHYRVVYDLVRRRWQCKLKRPRPNHLLQDREAVEEFSHKVFQDLSMAVLVAPDLHLRYWVEDESRFGLKPITRRRITARGMAPISLEHWRFKWVWLYGLVEPLTGASCFWCRRIGWTGYRRSGFTISFSDQFRSIGLGRFSNGCLRFVVSFSRWQFTRLSCDRGRFS